MYLLLFERGMYAWMRQGRLYLCLRVSLSCSKRSASEPEIASVVGDAYLSLVALRMTSRKTLLRLAAIEPIGPEASVDKILLSSAEQAVYDAARQLLSPDLEISDSEVAQRWRQEWYYSRAASILGGAADVQRDIVAEHLLGLPRSRSGGSRGQSVDGTV
jgi:alkylation response protein AidB-like acyl-CoA dehydrogenase